MKDMLVAVAGSEEELARKPRAAFTCCPSPPLKWSEITSQNIIDLAKHRIPISILPVPLVGLASPATLAGSLVQHVAEFFSGLVLAQLVNPRTPVLFGGSPAPIDQRSATALVGSVETVLMTSSLSQIAKALGLPSDMYVGLTNSNLPDEQASAETMLGMAIGALAGINMIEGAGMVEFESCQSFEKLVMDNEIAGMVYRLLKGIEVDEGLLAMDIIKEVGAGGSFTSCMKAMRLVMERFKKEIHLIGPVFNFMDRKVWVLKGGKDTRTKARELVNEILSQQGPELPPKEVLQKLNRIMDAAAKKYGVSLEELPLSFSY
jgi:trimethylamine--corrinoid protein Co-methyltransferase